MGWDGMGWDGMGWSAIKSKKPSSVVCRVGVSGQILIQNEHKDAGSVRLHAAPRRGRRSSPIRFDCKGESLPPVCRHGTARPALNSPPRAQHMPKLYRRCVVLRRTKESNRALVSPIGEAPIYSSST